MTRGEPLGARAESRRGDSLPVDIGTLRGSDLDARPGVFDIALIVSAVAAAIATSLTFLARQGALASLEPSLSGKIHAFSSLNALWALLVVPAVWVSVFISSMLMWRPVNRDIARLALLVTIPIPLLVYLVRVLAAGVLSLTSPTELVDLMRSAPRSARSMYFFALIPVAVGAVLLEVMPSVRSSQIGRTTVRLLAGATVAGVFTAFVLRSAPPTTTQLRPAALVCALALGAMTVAVAVMIAVDRQTSITLRAAASGLTLIVAVAAIESFQVFSSAAPGRADEIGDVIVAMTFLLVVVPLYAAIVQAHDYVFVGRSLMLPPSGRQVLPVDVESAFRAALRTDDVTLALAAGYHQQLLDTKGHALPIEADSPRCRRILSGGEFVGAVVWSQHPPESMIRTNIVVGVLGPAVARARMQLQVLARLTDISESRRRVAEAEITARRQLERDIHDGAQQRLTAALIMLKQARHADEPREAIDSISTQVELAIDDIHALTRGLNSPALIAAGLFGAVDELVEVMPIAVHTDVTRARFDPILESAAFFAVREGLTNVLKHADATSATVTAAAHGERLRILIADDGVGGATLGGGTGLIGLSDRIEALGGHVGIDSPIGIGTELLIDLPTETHRPLDQPFELERQVE